MVLHRCHSLCLGVFVVRAEKQEPPQRHKEPQSARPCSSKDFKYHWLPMDFDLSEWLNLVARWVHVFAAILWIGQTWFFTWLDKTLTAEEAGASENAPGRVWMVHSGGFYAVERQKAGILPKKLHWFRWEAALTWMSGMVLLIVVYYWGGALV